MDYWVTLITVLFALVEETAATYCRVETNHGTDFVFCFQKCCQGPYRTRYDVCCTYDYPTTGMVVGGGVGLVVVIATCLLCCFYLFCKRQLRRIDRSSGRSSGQSRANTRNTVIPTVSETVISPPSYEELPVQPPPYTAENLGFIDERNATQTENHMYPNDPPPKYSKKDKFPPKRK